MLSDICKTVGLSSVCQNIFSLIGGDTPGSYPPDIMPFLTAHYPVVTSVKDFQHLAQMTKFNGL